MADRVDYYFRQRVTEAELDLGFELLERADRNLAADLRVRGIVSGAVPAPHEPVADLTVDLAAPARAYDRLGQRIFFGTGQRVDCSTDHAGLPTEILSAVEERWVGVFLRFHRLLSEPRTDGSSREVMFRRDESFELVVRQAAAAATGSAPRVPLEPDELLVCEVKRRPGQTQILAADIDTSRREAFVFASGEAIEILSGTWSTLAPVANTAQAALDEVDAKLTAHVTGTGLRHRANQLDLPPRGFVAATNVEGAIHEIVDDLSSIADGSPGAARIGADAVPGAPLALGPSTVDAQLSQIAGAHNGHVGAASGAHHASAIAASPNGFITSTNVQAQLQEIVGDLALATAGAAGASRVGAAPASGTPRSLAAGTIESQLGALLGDVNTLEGAASALDTRVDDIERRIVDDEWRYPSPKPRTILLMPDAGADATTTPGTLPGWIRNVHSFVGGLFFPLRALAGSVSWVWQLLLPPGATLRGVRVLVQPGVARPTLSDRVGLRVFGTDVRFGPTLGLASGFTTAIARDNGTAAIQVIDVGALSQPIDNATRVYYAVVTAGNPFASDLVYALEVRLDDVGPTNG